jgi:GTP-binding protein HflX
MVTTYNKSDLVADQYALRSRVAGSRHACYVSARTAEGIPSLMDCIVATLRSLLVHVSVLIPYDRSELVAQCYECGRVMRADYTDAGIKVVADVIEDIAGRLAQFRVAE